jgi:hypothetical protein
MCEDSEKNIPSKDTQFFDQSYADDKLRPATGVGNGIIASMLILLPLIALVIWI